MNEHRDTGAPHDDASDDVSRTQPLPTLRKDEPPGDPQPPEGSGHFGADDPLRQSSSSAAYDPHAARPGRAGRLWSTRRIPALVVSLLLLAALALTLYDVVSVRLDRPGMAWRRIVADEFATRPLDDLAVRLGAIAVAVLGLWLLLLALTPGLRGLLPMRRTDPQVRAVLDRSAARLVLRDRALEVPGVTTARVTVRRRRARVHALAAFRDLDEVRADLDAALRDGVRGLDLARHMGLSVTVRRPGGRAGRGRKK